MSIIDRLFGKAPEAEAVTPTVEAVTPTTEAVTPTTEAEIVPITRKPEVLVIKPDVPAEAAHIVRGVWSTSFDGEKNFGEIGPIKRYLLNYHALSLRSWQAYLESDIAKTVIDRYCIWVVDKGLRLQCSPQSDVLESEGITINKEQFNDTVESRFSMWSKSGVSTINEMMSLNSLSKEVFKNAKVGGDVLIVQRLVDGVVKIQMIDGAHLDSPMGNISNDGNRIIDGVEINAYGKHLKYFVRKENGKHETIDAWSKSTGLRMAFLVYGSKYREDNLRGVPVIATSLETIKKIDRYKEAAVGGAEERQKIALFIEHDLNGSGENPFDSDMAMMQGERGKEVPTDSEGKALANTVAAPTNKAAFNMPSGSTLKSIESKQELSFPEFYSTNANIICASIGIPPNVAFSLYNDSFSASRAATKDWEHTITVERNDFYNQFYSPIYAFWFHTQVLSFKIDAPGYLEAFNSGNYMVVESYLNCRFTGPMFPHIDPVKEVTASRLKLGDAGKNIPLSTAEAETEILMSGEYNSNVEQFAKEMDKSNELGIISTAPETAQHEVIEKD